MPDYAMLTELLGLPNVRVIHYQLVGAERINLFIESTLPAGLCPACQQICLSVHETGAPQAIRDLALWQRQCWLRYAPRRFKCPTCADTFVERVVWREPGSAYTVRYEQAVYARTRQETVAQVARSEGLTEESVQSLFERWAKKTSPSGVTRA